MQNPIHLHDQGHQAAPRRHLGAPDTTIVLGEVPVGRKVSQRQGLRVPNLLVAFGVDRAGIIEQRGYSIDQWGKPPDFVLEVASETTGRNDIADKRGDYAAFGIPEYWRFDPSGGSITGRPWLGSGWLAGRTGPSPSRVRMMSTSGGTARPWDWTCAGRRDSSGGTTRWRGVTC